MVEYTCTCKSYVTNGKMLCANVDGKYSGFTVHRENYPKTRERS